MITASKLLLNPIFNLLYAWNSQLLICNDCTEGLMIQRICNLSCVRNGLVHYDCNGEHPGP